MIFPNEFKKNNPYEKYINGRSLLIKRSIYYALNEPKVNNASVLML